MVLAKCLAIAGASCRMKALQYVVKNARTSAVTLLLDFSVTACGLFRSRPDPDNLAGGGYWLDVFGLSANVTGLPKLHWLCSRSFIATPSIWLKKGSSGEDRKLTDNCGVLLLWTRK